MTTYNTGNPIGSKDPRDLYDNAENLDTAVNDTANDTWSDRLGRSRKTMSGMERQFDAAEDYREATFDLTQADREARFNNFIASSGYQFLGDYAAGIEITEYNQIVRDANGEFWRLSGQVELPYTTTGDWGDEESLFVAVGDAALRQDLANPALGASIIMDKSGESQQSLNDYLFKNTYYAEREGITTSNPDNSSAWEALHSRLKHGDVVVFGAGVYKFSRPMEISKVIRVEGKDQNHTKFDFYNQTHGIVRRVRWGVLRDLYISGTQKGTPFDFNSMDPNNINVGNIGLYDKYNNFDSFAGYNRTINVTIEFFDVGRANVTEGSSIWNGAYRETYNAHIQRNRCGLLFLNGATDDKYYGGILRSNSEIGAWVYAGSSYNNVKFIGTTIENNGAVSDSDLGNTGRSPSICNFYIGGESSVYLIGSYNENCYNIIADGGQLYKIGSHQQRTGVIDATKGGYVYYSGINSGEYYKVPYYNRLSSFIYNFARTKISPIEGSRSLRITSSEDGTEQGYSVRSRRIPVPSGITTDRFMGVKLGVKFKISSGFTANPGLRFYPIMRLYGKDGSYVAIQRGNWSKYLVTSGNGASTEISINRGKVTTSEVPAPSGRLSEGVELSHIEIFFSWANDDLSYPDFSIDNLDMTIDDIEIGLFIREEVNFNEYRHKTGTTYERPILIEEDRGYEYFDTQLNRPILWNGNAWDDGRLDSARMESATHEINTTGKYGGKLVYNTSLGKMFFAIGSEPTSPWRATDGSGDIVPS